MTQPPHQPSGPYDPQQSGPYQPPERPAYYPQQPGYASQPGQQPQGQPGQHQDQQPGQTAGRGDMPPPGFVRLNLQGNRLVSMITPTVKIDGYPVPAKYGENTIPVLPGSHVLSASAQWMWEYGKAQEQFSVQSRQTVEYWYAMPVLTFMKGAMGTTKQKVPGLLPFLLIICGLVLVILLIVVLAAL